MISPTRDLPNARKDQWSVDLQRELWRNTALDISYVGSNTSHLDRSFFNNTPQPGAGAVDPRRPSQKFRSRRIIQNDPRASCRPATIGGLLGVSLIEWVRRRREFSAGARDSS